MKQRMMCIRIDAELFKRYKIFCMEHDLSVPKQTAQLIRNLLDVDAENKRVKNLSKKE